MVYVPGCSVGHVVNCLGWQYHDVEMTLRTALILETCPSMKKLADAAGDDFGSFDLGNRMNSLATDNVTCLIAWHLCRNSSSFLRIMSASTPSDPSRSLGLSYLMSSLHLLCAFPFSFVPPSWHQRTSQILVVANGKACLISNEYNICCLIALELFHFVRNESIMLLWGNHVYAMCTT